MTTEPKVPQVFALRLPLSTRIEAAEIAKREGLSLNQFITFAVSERIARLELLHSGTPEEPSLAVEELSPQQP